MGIRRRSLSLRIETSLGLRDKAHAPDWNCGKTSGSELWPATAKRSSGYLTRVEAKGCPQNEGPRGRKTDQKSNPPRGLEVEVATGAKSTSPYFEE